MEDHPLNLLLRLSSLVYGGSYCYGNFLAEWQPYVATAEHFQTLCGTYAQKMTFLTDAPYLSWLPDQHRAIGQEGLGADIGIGPQCSY